jgi:hypothetical protein
MESIARAKRGTRLHVRHLDGWQCRLELIKRERKVTLDLPESLGHTRDVQPVIACRIACCARSEHTWRLARIGPPQQLRRNAGESQGRKHAQVLLQRLSQPNQGRSFP